MRLTSWLALPAMGIATTIAVTAPEAGPDRKAPRIVSAAMLDADGDARADRVRLAYSERIRHPRDRDGRYPFTLAGYRVRSVGTASGKTLVLLLVEKPTADHTAAPTVRYRRTGSKPVRDRAGNQAVAQTFRRTRAHGRAPQDVPSPTPGPQPPPPAPPTATDRDGDGARNDEDCAPDNAAIHPSAADLPDLAFVDSNCDGIDGDEEKAVFVSPLGNDANPGTKAEPKREIQAAVGPAGVAGKDVYAAGGTYGRLTIDEDVDIYGGYAADTWSRSLVFFTSISGSPEGVFVDAQTGVVLQNLSVHGNAVPGTSAYGIRAIDGSSLRLERVTVTAGNGADGAPGANGTTVPGSNGGQGGGGEYGDCDGDLYEGAPLGGAAGASSAGRSGGTGGHGGEEDRDGGDGATAPFGAPGGPGGGGGGGDYGDPGKNGGDGLDGAPGSAGSNGAGGQALADLATRSWSGRDGSPGSQGAPGNGGGGGGGGGGQDCVFCLEGDGGGGGGGGGGAQGGTGGQGGRFGHGSFGVYLSGSTIVVTSGSSVIAGNGGTGGRGGAGGAGGTGGPGGQGNTACPGETGAGGFGGRGGNGGRGGGGGGGAGGPSVGIFKGGTSTATVTNATVRSGNAGPGGAGGAGGTGAGGAGEPGTSRPVFPA